MVCKPLQIKTQAGQRGNKNNELIFKALLPHFLVTNENHHGNLNKIILLQKKKKKKGSQSSEKQQIDQKKLKKKINIRENIFAIHQSDTVYRKCCCSKC